MQATFEVIQKVQDDDETVRVAFAPSEFATDADDVTIIERHVEFVFPVDALADVLVGDIATLTLKVSARDQASVAAQARYDAAVAAQTTARNDADAAHTEGNDAALAAADAEVLAAEAEVDDARARRDARAKTEKAAHKATRARTSNSAHVAGDDEVS